MTTRTIQLDSYVPFMDEEFLITVEVSGRYAAATRFEPASGPDVQIVKVQTQSRPHTERPDVLAALYADHAKEAEVIEAEALEADADDVDEPDPDRGYDDRW